MKMKQNTKKYKTYGSASDVMSVENVVKLFKSDMAYVSDNHPEILRLLDFLYTSIREIKENKNESQI